MVLEWTWAGAVALLEQDGLALCVVLALEMRCTLCLQCTALQMLMDDMPTLFWGVHSMCCFVWQDDPVLMSRFECYAMRIMLCIAHFLLSILKAGTL